MPPPLVLPLDHPDARAVGLAGGKAAALAELAAFDVPDGFVVTTEAFRLHAQAAGADEELLTLDDAKGEARALVAHRVRARLREAPLPREVENAILAARRDRDWPHGAAVRSSARTEDLPEASFAGQHDTFLGVLEEGRLLDAVRACFASAFHEPAVLYRHERDAHEDDVAVAVLVQRMIRPEASGVLFTADPVTGRRSTTVVSAVRGTGERLVAGTAEAATVRLDARTGRVLAREGPPLDALTEGLVRDLAALGARIGTARGAPQDVEWALEGGGVHVLQARPITTLYPLPDPAPTDGRVHVYTSFGHKQAMTDAMPRLTLDLWRRAIPTVLGPGARSEVGELLVVAGGRLYGDATPLLSRPRLRAIVLRQLRETDEPGARALEAWYEARAEEGPTGDVWNFVHPRLWAQMLGGALGHTLFGRVEGAAAREHAWAREEAEELERRLRLPADAEHRLDRALAAFDEMLPRIFDHVTPIFAGAWSEMALRRMLPDADVEALERGLPDDAVTRMNLRLADVIAVARAHPEVAHALRAGEGAAGVRTLEGGAAFERALARFLDEYGFRADGEIDPSRPRWREDPGPILQAIRGNLAGPPRDEHAHLARLADEAADAAERIVSAAREKSPLHAAAARRLVHVARGYLGLREHPKLVLAHVIAEVRREILLAADELVARGQLDHRDDVWHLPLASLERAVRDHGHDVRAEAEAGKREHARNARLRPPNVMTSEGEVPAPPPREDVPAGALGGTPVSPGVVEGTVRVVRDPRDAVLRDGEILVAPYCDPGWTPLFLNAKGIVAEVGGPLTHGGIVARESGIPMLASVRDATTKLHDGERVRVDADAGYVQRLGEG